MFFVYVIKCQQGKYYIGSTGNLSSRIEAHNAGKSTWTSRYSDWKLIYSEKFMTLKDAKIRENFIKKQKGGDGFYKIVGS
jgi:putative endonuclease